MDELDFLLDHIPSGRGRKAKPLDISYVRDLGEGDLDLIMNPPPLGVEIKPRARMKNSHHQLARLLAEGRRPQECSAILGHAPSTISSLQGDPAFKELVSYYEAQVREVFLDVHQRLANLGMDVIEELQERVIEAPGDFSPKELREIAEMALDRSVAPPKAGAKGGPTGAGMVQLNVQFVAPSNPAQAPTANAAQAHRASTPPEALGEAPRTFPTFPKESLPCPIIKFEG